MQKIQTMNVHLVDCAKLSAVGHNRLKGGKWWLMGKQVGQR